jgi:Protein of unknown function (DUF1214)
MGTEPSPASTGTDAPATGQAQAEDRADRPRPAPAALEGWGSVRRMLEDMTAMVETTAETELELLEGLRVLARATALCAELSLDVDHERPWFFSMNTEARLIGGPDPGGRYHLAMIDGRRRYRVTGQRSTVTYLGFQVLAGTGLTPRRMAAYLSDTDLQLDAAGRFSFVLAAERPNPAVLAGSRWVRIPEDASGIVVRQYVARPGPEAPAQLDIEPVDPPGQQPPLTDAVLATQFTAMAWTIAKLTTLHQSIRPELLELPNQLVTAEAEALGGENTTPDNLYMLGTFRLGEGEILCLEFEPPDTRYWSVTVENIWHECIEPRRRRSSLTNATAVSEADGTVTVPIGGSPPDPDMRGAGNWLDTGERHRGFVVLRWLDNPTPPDVRCRVLASDK